MNGSNGCGLHKAISLHQPYAQLIAVGAKSYETRSWKTNYRGLIAIHACSKPARWNEHKRLVSSFKDLLNYKDCEYSAVVAIANLTDCIEMTEEFIAAQSETELRCGDWQVGRYAWKLENLQILESVEAKGKQGLWNWEPPVNLLFDSFSTRLKTQEEIEEFSCPLPEAEILGELHTEITHKSPRKRSLPAKRSPNLKPASGSLTPCTTFKKGKAYTSYQYNYDVRDPNTKRGWRTAKVGVPKFKKEAITNLINQGKPVAEILEVLGR